MSSKEKFNKSLTGLSSKNKKIKIGILHEGDAISWNQHEVLENLFNCDLYEIYWINLKNHETSIKKFSRKLRDMSLFQLFGDLVFKIYEIFGRSVLKTLCKIKTKTYFMNEYNFEKVIQANYYLTKKNSCFVDDESINSIVKLKLDFLYRSSGGGIFKSKIISAAKYGIISLHHGDNTWNRGGPPGFWEVYYRVSKTGFIIQILNENLDGGTVIHRGSIRTKRYYWQNKQAIFVAGNNKLNELIVNPHRFLNQPKNDLDKYKVYDGTILRNPTIFELGMYVSKLIYRDALKFVQRKILNKKHNWLVGYQLNDWRGASLKNSKVLVPPKGHFYADPFILGRNGSNFIFFEDYIYSNKSGVISCVEVNNTGEISRHEDILKLGCHQSFPFIFEYKNEVYMIPETRANKCISLFKCIEFPYEWKKLRDFFTDINAVDTMVFPQNDLWWLLTTVASNEADKADSKLCLYFSKTPISTKWNLHKQSPIIEDPLEGRNGGLLRAKDRIFRVSQTPDFEHYGKSCSTWEIDFRKNNLSLTHFQNIQPHFGKNIKSIHHMHGSEHSFVFDFEKN